MNTWLKGLLAALIGGAANAVTTSLVAPETFNFGNGLGKLASVAGASAIVSAAMYLKQSPIPPGPAAPPSKGSGILTAAALLLAPCSLLFLGGCTSAQLNATTTALNVEAPVLLSALNGGNPKTNTDILAGLYAAEIELYSVEGQTVPAGLINTGSAQDDAVLNQYAPAGSAVTAQSLATLASVITSLGGTP